MKLLIVLILVFFSLANSQDLDSTVALDTIKPMRLVVIGSGVAASYAVIYFALLKDGWWDKAEPFRFEPLYSDMHYASNLDKIGHFYTGVLFSDIFAMSYDWAGMTPFASALWAGISVGFTQIFIEFKDGFSPYGYSVWDATAGTLGGFYAMGKRYIPVMQYVDVKFSYWPNSKAYWKRSREKGETGILFDDYYGGNHTYWLTFKIPQMSPLALAFGLGLHDEYVDGEGWDKIRHGYYVSLDYDFEAIFHPQKTWSKNLVTILNHIKFPAPAIRLHPEAKFFPLHPMYGFSVNL